jgi:hypothetical protein
MNGEVQLIVTAESKTTYKTGAYPNAVLSLIFNDTTIAPLLSTDIINAFITQATNGGNKEIKAYDASDVLLATYELDITASAATGGPGGYQFYLLYGVIPDPNTVYITFTLDSISSTYLDLFENESISQNWQYTDLNNFQALGAFSREFRIPVTDRNQLALGALFDVNYSGGVNNYFHYKLPAEIRVDTLPIAKGYVRVRKIYQQQGKLNEIELAFYAETPDLYKSIGEKKLAALTDLPNLNEVVKYDNVTTSNSERIWALMDRGQLWSEEGQPNTRRIFDSTAPLFATDLTPAVRWDYLLQQIFDDAGFELEAGSLLTILGGYYMPWINKSYLDTDDLGSQYAYRSYNSGNITMPAVGNGAISAYQYYAPVSEAFDNNNNYDPTTGVYTAPGGGLFTFHISLSVSITGTISTTAFNNFQVFIVINGGTPQFIDSWFIRNYLFIDFNYGVNLLAGDTVEFAFRWESATGFSATCTINAGSGDLGGSLIELVGTRFDYGSTLIYNLNAPDMRQIDFLSDVIKMHNCAIVPDRINPKKISIVPYNSYIGSGDDKDWNAKLDISKDITMYSTVELQKNKTTFTYTAGEDYLSKLYKDNGRIYGDYKAEGYTVNPDTTPSSFTTGDNTVQLITRSMPCGLIPGTDVAVPQFINDKNEFIVPGPRCGFSITHEINIQIFDDSVGVEAPVTYSVPTLSHYSDPFASLDDFDLNWAPEVPPRPINANPYNNLFNLYWRNAMNELYSPDARIMEAYFALDLSDILTFKFNDIIFVNGAQWRILEVTDYKVGNFESTRVKLIKYLRTEADCTSTPNTISTNGIVNFVDGNGDPVASTQSCCVRYGYSWSESDAECFAFNQNGDRPTNGITGTNTNPIPKNAISKPINGNTRSIQTGVVLDIVDGNNNMLAVGDTLKLDAEVRGNVMVGKNVYTNLPGLHLGGGFTADDRTLYSEGSRQYGVVIQGVKDTLASAGNKLTFTIEDKAASYINLPNDTHLMCVVSINVFDFNTNNYHTSLHHVFLKKVGATATASAVTTINTINSFPSLTLTFSVDTTTNTAQHRMIMTAGGTGFPYSVQATMSIQYTQIR